MYRQPVVGSIPTFSTKTLALGTGTLLRIRLNHFFYGMGEIPRWFESIMLRKLCGVSMCETASASCTSIKFEYVLPVRERHI